MARRRRGIFPQPDNNLANSIVTHLRRHFWTYVYRLLRLSLSDSINFGVQSAEFYYCHAMHMYEMERRGLKDIEIRNMLERIQKMSKETMTSDWGDGWQMV